jgi:hypothetical protein
MTPARTCCRNSMYCTLCCFTHGVPEIDKLPFARCRHCMEETGCAAHSVPPDACSAFRCAYLRGVSEDDTWPHQCRFVQEYRWTRYGHTWIMSAIEADKLDTSLARREMIRALERGLVVVLEKPGRTDITFADDRPALAIIPHDRPQRVSLARASEYLGFPVAAKPYVHADLGVRAWHQL